MFSLHMVASSGIKVASNAEVALMHFWLACSNRRGQSIIAFKIVEFVKKISQLFFLIIIEHRAHKVKLGMENQINQPL